MPFLPQESSAPLKVFLSFFARAFRAEEGYENVRIEALRALGALGAGIPGDLEVLAAVLRALVDSNSHTQKAASATILQLLDVLDVGSRQAVMALAIDQLQPALEKENWCATLDLLARLAEGAGAGEVEVLVRALFPLLKAWDPDVTLGYRSSPMLSETRAIDDQSEVIAAKQR